MASDDISQLADALAKTHVGDGELSFKGLGLKLDNAESGQTGFSFVFVFIHHGVTVDTRAQVSVFSSDLTSCSLLSVGELVREIEQYQGLRALRLEGNTVGVDAARAIAKALEHKDQLQVSNA